MSIKGIQERVEVEVANKEFKAEDLKKAVEILSAECFGAMSVCNSLNGQKPEPPWEIIRCNSWADIVAEAKAKGIDTDSLKCAVTDTPVVNSGNYQYALGRITDQQRKQKFQTDVKNGDGNWKPMPKVITEGWPAHTTIYPNPEGHQIIDGGLGVAGKYLPS